MVKSPLWLTTALLLNAAPPLMANDTSAPLPASTPAATPPASAPQATPPARSIEEEIAWLEKRGRELADYDHAAWIATDILLAWKPDHSRIEKWMAIHDRGRWWVFFGQYKNAPEEGFLAFYVFSCPEGDFKKMNSVTDFAGVIPRDQYARALAIDNAKQFLAGELTDPPYNSYVLREPDDSLSIYFMPATTKKDEVRYGADMKVSVSSDGRKITGSTRLHKVLLSLTIPEVKKEKTMAGFHAHVLTSLPTETDVAFSLIHPELGEMYVASKEWFSIISSDGRIKVVGPTDQVLGINKEGVKK